jgi:glycosyltransferase involved in cell wall biosynthesis
MLFASRYPGLAPERVPLGVASKRAPPSALSKRPSYLSFGFIGPGKRLEAVVDASKELPDRQFTIAGTPAGPRGEVYAAKLMADAKSLQNLRVVSNWLSDGDLDQLLEETTATVLPTTGDYRASAAYTRSISRGVPVIAIRGSSVGEPVEETGSGAVAEECSGPSIAAAIRHLESEFSRAAQGVAQAQEKYSWASVSRGLVDLYARAIAAPS